MSDLKVTDRSKYEAVNEEQYVEDAYVDPIPEMSKLKEYEIIKKLGQGTFGVVQKARSKANGHTVAIKQLLNHQAKEGFPITALREITILKQMHHQNILSIEEILFEEPNVTNPADLISNRGSFYTVSPYMSSDLVGILENPSITLKLEEIKCLMKQLLEGIQYIHDQNYLHRDIKAANLLVDQNGILKIADFGLARLYHGDCPKLGMGPGGGEKAYTALVVTRWYRPPEILLGERKYTTAVDLWGIGCVFAELFTRKPILIGKTDAHQAQIIFELIGSPSTQWPDAMKLPNKTDYNIGITAKRTLEQRFADKMPKSAIKLLSGLLTLDPYKRMNALDALQAEFFNEAPLPLRPKDMPSFGECHEIDKEKFKKLRESNKYHHRSESKNMDEYDDRARVEVPRYDDRYRKEEDAWDNSKDNTASPYHYKPLARPPNNRLHQNNNHYTDKDTYNYNRYPDDEGYYQSKSTYRGKSGRSQYESRHNTPALNDGYDNANYHDREKTSAAPLLYPSSDTYIPRKNQNQNTSSRDIRNSPRSFSSKSAKTPNANDFARHEREIPTERSTARRSRYSNDFNSPKDNVNEDYVKVSLKTSAATRAPSISLKISNGATDNLKDVNIPNVVDERIPKVEPPSINVESGNGQAESSKKTQSPKPESNKEAQVELNKNDEAVVDSSKNQTKLGNDHSPREVEAVVDSSNNQIKSENYHSLREVIRETKDVQLKGVLPTSKVKEQPSGDQVQASHNSPLMRDINDADAMAIELHKKSVKENSNQNDQTTEEAAGELETSLSKTIETDASPSSPSKLNTTTELNESCLEDSEMKESLDKNSGVILTCAGEGSEIVGNSTVDVQENEGVVADGAEVTKKSVEFTKESAEAIEEGSEATKEVAEATKEVIEATKENAEATEEGKEVTKEDAEATEPSSEVIRENTENTVPEEGSIDTNGGAKNTEGDTKIATEDADAASESRKASTSQTIDDKTKKDEIAPENRRLTRSASKSKTDTLNSSKSNINLKKQKSKPIDTKGLIVPRILLRTRSSKRNSTLESSTIQPNQSAVNDSSKRLQSKRKSDQKDAAPESKRTQTKPEKITKESSTSTKSKPPKRSIAPTFTSPLKKIKFSYEEFSDSELSDLHSDMEKDDKRNAKFLEEDKPF
ncbi:BUR1 [Candida pseudojiufengensis]|uniref:BUR1 n=1 Tax=Candida pseudojiufengensis TaxID=497109 RepID=UPI00222562CE|nr:BUR1 [Candida pseudojiufengensis]KAI5964803.1 BUR1 [Candida pseudojiufengensis]